MNFSPLRYPGGKSKIAPLVKLIIRKTNYADITYIEPFAGGAGVALSLLLDDSVSRVVINDYDKAIYSFWRALKEDTNGLLDLIEKTPVTIKEWKRQKEIYLTRNHRYTLELGFAAFFLNRTNRSGIIGAGPIGGYDQSGNFKIDARFNKQVLMEKVTRIAERKKDILIYNKEIRSFISKIVPQYQENAFVYFDPPYYEKGKRLYKNFFSHNDHATIANCISKDVNCEWIITYDDVPQLREIYAVYATRKYNLNYSVANKGKGSEIIIFKSPYLLPSDKEIQASVGNFCLELI